MSIEFFWIAVAVVTVVSTARLTRLLTYDKFPPIRWVRNKFADFTDGSDWQMLAYCPYCMSFWVSLAVLGVGWGSDWHVVWWFANGVLAASYLAAILMVHDGDEDEDDNAEDGD